MNDNAEYERLLDDLVRTRAKLATANEERDKARAQVRILALYTEGQLGYLRPSDEWMNLGEPLNDDLQDAAHELVAQGLLSEFGTGAEAGDSTADETRPSDMPPMYGPPEWLARKGPVCNCNHPMWWHELGKGRCPRSVDDRPIRQPYDASSELNTQGGAS